MKTCTKCTLKLPLDQFPDEARRKDGKYPWCRRCLSKHRAERYVKRDRKFSITHKVCSLCKEDKPRDQFKVYPSKTLHYRCIACEEKEEHLRTSGMIFCSSCNTLKDTSCFTPARRTLLKSQCKDCAKKYIKNNKARIQNNRLLKYYGITLDQYNDLLRQQDYKCAVCQKHYSEFKNMLCVDHAHHGPHQGAIRGLCCDSCNRFVVWKHTDGRVLRAAADYLDKVPSEFFVPEQFLHGPKKRRKKKH